MGKETVLPKNIRQIGEIHGRERVCIEDYVMTYIHKKEAKEEQGCLGVFLGEQQSTEEAEYLFIRGILEVPPENENGETDWNTLREQQQKFFPEWTVQGCCVIGTYPAGRMEKLAGAVPESTGLLYHLQEQEETLYWMADGQYNRLPGYFVFYEQNRKMQEYLSALYGEESVEKESLPDKAIRSFRAKVEEKGTQKNSSFLRLASSFFVITVLVIGAIAVNRLDDIRKVRKTADITVAEDKAAAGQAARIKASGDGGSTAVSSGGAAPDAQQEVEANAGDDAVLAGSDSFWEDTTAELNELMNSAPGENYGDDGAASQAADGGTQQSADDQGAQNVSSQSVDAASQGADGQSADAASQSAGSQAVDVSSQSADGQSADAASQSANGQVTGASSQDMNGQSAGVASQNADGQSADVTSQSANGQVTDVSSQNMNGQAAASASQSADSQAVDVASQNANDQAANASSQSMNGQAAAAASQNTNDPASQGTGAQNDVKAGTVTTTNGGEPDGTQEAVSRQVQATYTIREGDTLADICNKYYGGLDRLQELCDVNAITDANLIMPGQKLVLP